MQKGNPNLIRKPSGFFILLIVILGFLSISSPLRAQFPPSLIEAFGQDSSYSKNPFSGSKSKCDSLIHWIDTNIHLYEQVMPNSPVQGLNTAQIEARSLLDTVTSYARAFPCEGALFDRVFFLLQKVGYDYIGYPPRQYLRSSQLLEAALDTVRSTLPMLNPMDKDFQDNFRAWRKFLFTPLARIYNDIGDHQSALTILDTSLLSLFLW